MRRLALTGLLQINLPDEDVLLCDGGFFTWGSGTYRSRHYLYGTIGSIDALTEGVSDEVPALQLTFLLPSGVSPGDVAQPGFQTCRARAWLAAYDPHTGLISGTPDLLFDGQIDQITYAAGRSRKELPVSLVSLAERLFLANIGNTLSPSFHKRVWPGELGHDNAVGLSVPIAWGTADENTTASSSNRLLEAVRQRSGYYDERTG